MIGRRQLRAASLLMALLTLSPLPASARQAEEIPEPPDSRVTEHVEVRLVQMSILARDRQGRPVADLTADEIVVKEQGRRMELAYFEPFRRPREEGPPPDVRLHIGAPGGPEGEFPAAVSEPSYLILFVDVENDQRLKKEEAIRDAIRFLKNELDPGHRVAVFSYDGEIRQDSPFTADREALAHAVRRAYDRPPRPQVDLIARIHGLIRRFEDCAAGSGESVGQADEACIRAAALEYVDERRPPAEDFVNALDGLVRLAAGLQARKTILSLSHGVATDPAVEALEAARAVFGPTDLLARVQLSLGSSNGAGLEMDRLTDTAIRHRVTMHFVDRNLLPASDTSARQGFPLQPGARPLRAAFEAPQREMGRLASHTGGIFIRSPGALYPGLKKAIGVEQAGYHLGYRVDGYRSREDLAKVRIRCTRGGVKIGHRRGYYEQRPGRTVVGRISLGKPRLPEDGREGQVVPFTVQADPYVLGYEVGRAEAEADFTLHVLVRGENGRLLADSFHFINHAYPRETWDTRQAEPITIQGWVEAPDGRYTLVAYLHNSRSGRKGELSRELVVEEGRSSL